MILINNKGGFKSKKSLIIYMAIALIVIGLCITIINMVKYSNSFISSKKGFQPDNSANKEPNSSITESTEINDTTLDEVINTELSKNKTVTAIYDIRPETGEEVGELYIPKLDATLTIYEGTSEDELDKGVGHYADSVLPGENDNSVLSGHRDTVFRKLGEVGEGDSLIVTTSAGEFEYRVDKVRIVDKDDRTVIVPKPRATLTVSTCYPFAYIGPAPKRYILVTNLISATLN